MTANLVSRLVWPIRQQYLEAVHYSDLMGRWDPSQTASIQLQRLQAMWDECVHDVPYYRDLAATGNAPRRIASWDDFRAIPILDRSILQDKPEAFRRLSGPPEGYLSTTGSSGQPVKLGQWRGEGRSLRIAKLVPWIRLGYSPGSPMFLIWGHAHLLGNGWRRYWNHAVRKVKDWALGYRRVDAYTIDRQKAARIACRILRLKPLGIIGYAAILDLLVRYVEPYHDDLRQAGVRFVMSCAEPPPRDDTLSVLRGAFNCPILQEFGGVDFGHVGWKLDEEPFRTFPDLNVLEVEPAGGRDDCGSALVTTLYRRYVPLIRYRQGDLIVGARSDPHGHVFQFDELAGRLNDAITMSDGVQVHSVAVLHCFKEEELVYNVQFSMTDSGPRFRLVIAGTLPSYVETRIRGRLRQVHTGLEHAVFEYVADLATNRAGKRRWFFDERTSKPGR